MGISIMGDVEISIDEEGVLRVVQHYDLRVLLRRLRPEGFERHRVVKRPNCDCFPGRDRDANYWNQFFFLLLIIYSLISLLIFEQLLLHDRSPYDPYPLDYTVNQTWLFHFQIGFIGVVLLAVFAAILVVGVFMKKTGKNISSAPQRREEVQTVSALVQQV